MANDKSEKIIIESDIDKIKKKRTVFRMATTKLLNRIETILSDENIEEEIKINELTELQDQLSSKVANLRKLDSDIEFLTDIDSIEAEILASEEYQERALKFSKRIERFLKIKSEIPHLPLSQNYVASTHSAEVSFHRPCVLRLPKLEILRYYGDHSKWVEFWDQFKSAIGSNDSLNDIEKFNYLKSLCGGAALNAISGLSLTDKNYRIAVNILTERFGRTDLTINAHMNRLLNLEAIKSSSNVFALRKMYDECLVNIRSLKALEIETGSWQILCCVLLKLLPEDLILEFNRKRKSKSEFDVEELMEFLKSEIEVRESAMYLNKKRPTFVTSENNSFKSGRFVDKRFQNTKSATALTASVGDICIFCNLNHDDHKCQNFSIEDKLRKLKAEGRCHKCFKRSHLGFQCRVIKFPCKKCGNKNHHEAICASSEKEISEISTTSRVEERNNSDILVSSVAQSGTGTVFLQTCNVVVKSGNKSKLIRILLDTGSQKSFITYRIAEELKLKIQKSQPIRVYGFGGQDIKKEPIFEIAKVELRNRTDPSRCLQISGFLIEKITNVRVPVPTRWLKQMTDSYGLQLSDNGSIENIDVLIGADYLSEVMNGICVRLSKRLLAIGTTFGFTVQGHSGDNIETPIVMNLAGIEIIDSLKNLWELEALGIQQKNELSFSDSEALEQFEKNTKKKSDRYETRLIWKKDHGDLGNNFYTAEKRLLSLKGKLEKNPELLEDYKRIIDEQLNEGIIERCEPDFEKSENESYYMPHRAVVKKEKDTTKVRIVYDASSKGKNYVSLNECLLSGPNLNPDLLEVILNFRKGQIGFCSDVEKAFLQISLAPEDRDFLRFLWFDEDYLNEDILKKIKCFRMTRVPFGVSCSPFLLSATIRYHLKFYEPDDSEACNMLEKMYVDDLIYSVDSVEEAYNLSSKAQKIMSEASMKLRKWETNSVELKKLWKDNRFNIRPVAESCSRTLKVLGMTWNCEEDSLRFEIEPLLRSLDSAEVTKRGVLKTVAKIFDPLGILAPFTIRMKCFLQELWERGLAWDEMLSPDLKSRWEEWCSELRDITNIVIPRQYNISSTKGFFQVCIFSDASPKAYGAVAYIRAPDREQWMTSFILAKSRVAPLKTLSLPRLELMGTVIASRLAEYLKRTFHLDAEDIYLWTDSEICLYWIKSTAKTWKPFVSHRVMEIHEKTLPQNWKFCKGAENPADKLTRGLKTIAFVSDELWWKGPRWLSQSIETWDTHFPKNIKNPCEEVEEERRKPHNQTVNLVLNEDPNNGFSSRFSSWTKLIRVMAWCIRFCQKAICRQKGFLTSNELKKALRVIVRQIQVSEFSEEIKALKSEKSLKTCSKIVSLNPFLDENGLLRVGGRLVKAEISEDQKHPIILPKKHYVTRLLIKHYHENHLHGGVTLLLSAIRQNFWIINAKEAIRSYIWTCVRCHRFRAETATQLMGELPKSRVVPSRVFSKIGVDFAGPFFIKMKKGRGGQTTKCYVCLFICLAIKAIHLEVVCDLSSDAFIASLRRFAARRGHPQEISCDCGTNFVGAAKEIKKMMFSFKNDEKFHNYLADQSISWKFNPPGAPHQGGLWEAGVKSMKYHLRRVMGSQTLSLEEFLTLISQVEACLNSRPIIPVSTDPSDLTALTPGHFLIGTPLTAIPDHDLAEVKVSTLKRWELTQQMFQSFWKRWKTDYLSTLNQRAKWHKPKDNLKVSDLVLIKDDNQPPMRWKLGRIIQVFPGTDGKVRVVTLKTADGELKRPITKLSPLP